MRKICMLVGYFPFNRGGAEHQAYLLAKRLQQHLDVFFISAGNHEDRIITHDGFKVYLLKVPKLFNRQELYFLLGPRILRILSAEQPHWVFQTVCSSATGFAAIHCKRSSAKMIWYIASDRDTKSSELKFSKSMLFDLVEKKIGEYGIRNSTYTLGLTEHQNELLVRNYSKSCDLIIPPFHPTDVARTHKADPVKIVWIANIKRLKQPELFLQLAKTFESWNNVQFHMIGRPTPGRFQRYITDLMSSLRHFHYSGELTINQVDDILRQSHILVNTSEYEGFPNTFVQAWIHSVPVVSLNVDPDNIIKRHRIGFHSNTFRQLIEDVVSLISNEALRTEMGERAHQFALSNHSFSNIDKIISLIMSNDLPSTASSGLVVHA